MANKKEIYIIRHGETEWNILKKLQGCEADIDLNDNGQEQAMITGKYLNDYPPGLAWLWSHKASAYRSKDNNFDVIYSSPLKRALSTARIIADEIHYDGNIITLDGLKEICVGKLSGTIETDRRNNPQFKEFNDLKLKYVTIGDPIERTRRMIEIEDKISKIYSRETSNDMYKRVKNVFDQIISSNHRKIIVVTHGGVISTLYMLLQNNLNYVDGDVTRGMNCKIGYIEYNDGKLMIVTNPNTLHFALYGK